MAQGLALSGQIIAFLEGLHLAGGDHDLEPFKVLDWERAFIKGAFAEGAEVSALSIARGNGKSCLLAGVAASGVSHGGPLQGNRREIVCVASSFMQARIIFEDVLAMEKKRVGRGVGNASPFKKRIPRPEAQAERNKARSGGRKTR